MCGIIGYAGGRVCKPLLLGGLERLEYRGYDSAGLSLLEDGDVSIVRAVGKLAAAAGRAPAPTARPRRPASATPAGPPTARPSDAQRPPAHRLRRARLVVHNGIIENYVELKERAAGRRAPLLHARPTPRSSPTWSSTHYEGDLVEAVAPDLPRLEGHTTRSASSAPHAPRHVVGARLQPAGGRPRRRRELRGLGHPAPSCPRPAAISLLEDGELVVVTPDGVAAARPRPARRSSATRPTSPGTRSGREGRLRALHAQGDPRAARGMRETIARAARTRDARPTSAAWTSTDQELRAHRPGRHHGLRHQLPRRAWSAST